MKKILVPPTATDVCLKLCGVGVNFFIQLKKKDVHVLRKFPISVDILDESVAKAIPSEVGESNHIHAQPSRVGGQSDKAIQTVAVNNLIPSPFPPPIPPPISSLMVGLDLHMKNGLEEQDEFLNNDLGMNHDNCNVRNLMLRKLLVIQTRGASQEALEPNLLSIELELKLFMHLVVMIFLAQYLGMP
ncbi:hypothetical protein TIFTF001_017567 [Ficus carica]|uniref:Uncharacterized protein n=1 Tax=Ficus carica TaxID=3494 RepID=A0AA88AQY5_FICCA|nr:hypothetical protein TIFTF001_017567 [Ficus carica]